MNSINEEKEMRIVRRSAWRIAALYAVVAFLWIGLSDLAVTLFVEDAQAAAVWQTYKGLLFVSVTSLFLFVERYQSEKRAHIARQRCKRLFQEAPLAMVSLDQDLHVTAWNPAAKQLFGWAEEEVWQRPFPGAPPKALAFWQSSFPGEKDGQQPQEQTLELAWEHKEDAELMLSMAAATIITPEAPPEIVCIFKEISDRKAAEAALRESEERYRLLIETAPDAIAIHQDGKIVFTNPSGASLLGAATPADLVGRAIDQVIHPDAWEAARERIQRLLQGEQGLYPVEDRYLRLDGSEVPVEVTASPTRWLGRPAVQVIVRDITARRETELQTRYHALLLENVSDAIIATDLNFIVRAWNQAAEEIYGWPAAEVVGKRLRDLVKGEYPNAAEEQVIAEFQAQGFWRGETIHYSKTGNPIWLLGSVTYIYDRENKKIGVVAVNKDITERKKAEELLEKSEARFRRLAEQAQDLIYRFRLQPSPGFEYVSPAATTITGYTPQEHYDDPELGYKLVHPEDRHLLQAAAEKNLRNQSLILRWRRKDGGVIVTEQRNTPIYDESGQLVAVEGIARDVTQREEAVQALALQVERQTLLATLGELSLEAGEFPRFIETALNRIAQALFLSGALLMEWQPDGGLRLFAAADPAGSVNLENLKTGGAPSFFLDVLQAESGLVAFVAAEPPVSAAENWLHEQGLAACLALVVRGTQMPFGVLALFSDRPHEFSGRETSFLQQAVNLVGLMIARHQVEQDLRQRVQQLGVLHQIDQEILSVQPVEVILETTLKLLRGMIRCDRSSIVLLSEDGQEGVIYALHFNGKTAVAPGYRVPLEPGTLPILVKGTPIFIHNLAEKPDLNPMHQQLYQEGIRTIVTVPLLAQGELVGMLNLSDRLPHRFSPKDMEMVQSLANQISIAIQNARLVTRLERRVTELDTIHKLSQRLQQLHEPKEQAQHIVQVLEGAMKFEYGAVLLIEEPDRLVPYALTAASQEAYLADASYLETQDLRVGKGIVGWVAQHGQSVRLGNISEDPRYQTVRENIQSELCVPMLLGQHIIGVINTETSRPNAYTLEDQHLLETMAAQIAITIQNSRLLERERQSQQQLRNLANYQQRALEAERAHIAREIHDEFGQLLTALKMDVAWQRKRLSPEDTEMLKNSSEMSNLIDLAINTVRNLASELRPGLLDDLGLVAAIEWQVNQFSQRTRIPCIFTPEIEQVDLGRDANIVVYRIVQEALTNISRYAQATLVKVAIRRNLNFFTLVVQDNGVGIRKKQLHSLHSLGLAGMRERARYLGGSVHIEGHAGKGTTITLQIPVTQIKEGSDD